MQNSDMPRHFEKILSSFTPEQKTKYFTKNRKVIEEEINRFCNGIPSENLVKTLKMLTESNSVLASLGKTMDADYDEDNQIIKENWDYFIEALVQLSNLPEFQEACREIYNKLYATKFFTDGTFIDKDSVEDNLKFALKDHFANLVTEDPEEFIKEFLNLPFDFLGLVVRHLVNKLVPEKKDKLVPRKGEAEKYVQKIIEKKDALIDLLNKIINEQHNVFSFKNAKTLIDTRAFVGDEEVNKGVLEYLARMINNENTREKLYDLFGKEQIASMRNEILAHPNYRRFLGKVSSGEEEPFFTTQGSLNPKRELSFDKVVEEYFNPELKAKREREETETAEISALEPTVEPATGEEPVAGEEPGTGFGDELPTFGGEEPEEEEPKDKEGGEEEIKIPATPEG